MFFNLYSYVGFGLKEWKQKSNVLETHSEKFYPPGFLCRGRNYIFHMQGGKRSCAALRVEKSFQVCNYVKEALGVVEFPSPLG